MQTRTLLLTGALMATSLCPAIAQEITASGNLQTETSWAALRSLVDAANNQSKMAMTLAEAIKACGIKGMLYSPDTPGADLQGCKAASMPNPAQLNVRSYTESLCKRKGYHTIVAACKTGEYLLGCGGGPGDNYESGESWSLIPEFKNNRCVGYVAQPACSSAYDASKVVAICYTP